MVVDHLSNLIQYEDLHPNISALIARGISHEVPRVLEGVRTVIPGVATLRVRESADTSETDWHETSGYELRVAEGIECIEHRLEGEDGKPECSGSFTLSPGVFALFLPREKYRVAFAEPGTRTGTYCVETAIQARKVPTRLNHQGTRELRGARLLLRRYRNGDASAMYRNWCSDPEVTKTLQWETHANVDVTRRILDSWLIAYQNPGYYHWAIEMDGELIGDIAVMQHSAESASCEIGYCLSRRWWNHGVMTEALRLVTRFLFEEAGFNRVYLRHDTQNPASGRVMQKAGFRMEGVMRESLLRKDGTLADLPLYAALKREWTGNADVT